MPIPRDRNRPPPARRLWALWLLGVVPLVGFALLVNFLGRRAAGIPFSWTLAAQWTVDWTLWALMAPGIVWLARRLPIERDRWAVGIAQHLVIGSLVSLFQLFLFVAVSRHVLQVPDPVGTLAGWYGLSLSMWFPYALLIYATISVATQVVEASRREGARSLEAATLREQLGHAKLRALRMQLHPHFLFNTLNTVSVLLRDERAEEADRMIVGLGELLHRSLDTIGRHEITLAEELDFVRRYLEIEQRRFSDRLTVEIDSPPDTTGAYVPGMILQPLVENAMRHGIERDPEAGRVRIAARRENGRLTLSVADDGPGFGSIRPGGTGGLGLRNTIRRLEELYGEEASLVIRRGAAGSVVELTLPYLSEPLLDETGHRERATGPRARPEGAA